MDTEIMSKAGKINTADMNPEARTLIEKLQTFALNLWWTWHPEVIDVFRDLDPDLWREVNHNPILMLQQIEPKHLAQRVADHTIRHRINEVGHQLDKYLRGTDSWGRPQSSKLRVWPVAYLSFEFGLHESLPTYAGGLGILAGDHLKSASDCGIPVIGIGLLYTEGYFQQRLNADGWQNEEYSVIDKSTLPIEPVMGLDGKRLYIEVPIEDRNPKLQIWRARVGRNDLYLLDSNLPENSQEDQELTGRLYEADITARIRQEIVLGVGGMRTLAAIGSMPAVVHCNEGHCAFALLEWSRLQMAWEGVGFEQARQHVGRRAVYTTHTPIPAGHDYFTSDLVQSHLGFMSEGLGLSFDELMALGRVNPGDKEEPFCMTVLALKMAHRSNGVSALHGRVSRSMWRPLWSNRSEQEVPIGHITNGVHVPSWLSPTMNKLFESTFGHNWMRDMDRILTYEAVSKIPDEELWEAHNIGKDRLIQFARRRLVSQKRFRGEPKKKIAECEEFLDSNAITIGFARRFAEYKRATLLFSDLERLDKLVNHPEHPVQFIFAGKAHPANDVGKQNIQRLVEVSNTPEFKGKIIFLENYDIGVGRHLVQGVDGWLNNPRKPLEACGTSGQKVVLNGGLNISVLDGWWAEAFDGSNGFAIGYGGYHPDHEEQNRRDQTELYRVLEEEVVPKYYARNDQGLPCEWLEMLRWSIVTMGWQFSADRMVQDYFLQTYLPAAGAVQSESRAFRPTT